MNTVMSRDGTPIAYTRQGSGPAVILVTGGLDDGAENAPLAVELAAHFTVFNYARRGRAGSGDTLPYALEREIEDLAALITEAGGSAHLYGVSSGGALVFEAAAAGVAADRLAVYEVPYLLGELVSVWREYVTNLHSVLADGRRGDALELFMRMAGSSEADIANARSSSLWPGLEILAPTLAYDAACIGDGEPPARLATITQPTLVTTGGQASFFEQAADAIVATMPHAHRQTLTGQGHVVDPTVMASTLERFFGQ